jgi:predicted S18 family serine protease
MKITDKNKEELFYEFSDSGSNEEITMSKDAFKKAIDKALNLYGVGNSLPSEEECNCEIIKEIKKQTKRIIEFNTEVQDLKFSFNGHKLTGLIQK